MGRGIAENTFTNADRRRVMFVMMFRPALRQEIFDMMDQELLAASLITDEGDVANNEAFGSTWILIIELLVQFLPVILEFLKKRNS